MSRALAAKGIRWLLALLVCVVAAELAARSFWRLCYGVPFAHPGRILYAYYPELREVDRVKPSHEDAAYDILLLGVPRSGVLCLAVHSALVSHPRAVHLRGRLRGNGGTPE